MSTGRNTTTRDRDRKAIARTKPPCGICEQPIDYSLASPDPMSFEVDHVIPIAKGGLDELANKQAAHRRPTLQPRQVGQAHHRGHPANFRDVTNLVTGGGSPPT